MLGHRLRRWTSIETTQIKRVICIGILANTKRSPNAELMLGHRRRRSANIKPTLGECPVFVNGVRAYWMLSCRLTQQACDIESMLFQCWPIVRDACPALKQHWFNVTC